jgi:polysaccharide export outer membrane protein
VTGEKGVKFKAREVGTVNSVFDMKNRVCMLMGVALLLSSCATYQKESAAGGLGPRSDIRGANANTGENYVLGPDDVVKILVEGHTEWSGEFTVKPNGMVFIPGFGEIRAEGMSKAKFETELTRSLERYINNPMATVDIVKYASEVIYILGEVGRPGEYSTGGKTITLRDAVILAGLPTNFAATSRVYIISPSSEKPNQRVVNLYRILYRGELE